MKFYLDQLSEEFEGWFICWAIFCSNE